MYVVLALFVVLLRSVSERDLLMELNNMTICLKSWIARVKTWTALSGAAVLLATSGAQSSELRVEPLVYDRGDASASAMLKRGDLHARPLAQKVSLGAPSTEKLFQEKSTGSGPGIRQKIGFSRAVKLAKDDASQTQWQWHATAKGTKVAAFSVTSESAKGVRMGLLISHLPWDTKVRVYAQTDDAFFETTGSEILASIHRNVDAQGNSDLTRTYWTPVIDGEESTIEVELPVGASAKDFAVSLSQISHLYDAPWLLPVSAPKSIGDAASCQIDISCTSDFSKESNATARMAFTGADGGSYTCTGTLVNDLQNSTTPYFLSANHCISVQSEASSLQTYWFYRSSSCGSGALSSSAKSLTGGATLLYTASRSSATDTSFMRLNSTPPTGVIFAGWDATSPSAGTSITGVHHPKGDLQKISYGTITSFSSSYLYTQWSRGVTEGGSSGSGLFKTVGSTNYLVGQLWGGGSSCTAQTAPDQYGRFDVAFNAALNKWLNPVYLPSGNRSPVYRFYNATTGAHFFTISAAERDYVMSSNPKFQYEGLMFYAYPTSGTGVSPIYRFYNTLTGSHFYTINSAERDFVITSLPNFAFEGSAWFAQTASAQGNSAMYRFYNTQTGTHFYTISAAERDYVRQYLPAYSYEGVGYYAWTAAN